MKFSIIIPVYNVEKYLKKCLESVYDQKYQNYEVIIVDDGSPDNSEKLIKSFIKEKNNFKYFKKKNGGLSDARNFGLSKATGDYILFLDGDDYLSKNLLNELIKEILKTDSDVIKFGCNVIDKDTKKYRLNPFSNLTIDEAICYLMKDDALEISCIYCYKRSFWQNNKFEFTKGRIHEDFGLIPLVLLKAIKISSISYSGYNYVIRENSIITTKNEKRDFLKFIDKLYFVDTNIPIIENSIVNKKTKKYMLSFYANNLIYSTKLLSKENKLKAINEIKKRKLDRYFLVNTPKRMIKKVLFKLSNSFYINYLLKFL